MLKQDFVDSECDQELGFAVLKKLLKVRGLTTSGSFLSLCESDKAKVKIELETIETGYKQWCKEVKMVEEKGVEATRKRCIKT